MIIAVDFDGVLCADAFPAVGTPNIRMIEAVKNVLAAGNEVVLWTCRVDNELKAAVEACKSWGLEFTAINDNTPSNKAKYAVLYPNGTRKVYADYYIDDHGIDYSTEKAIALLEILGGNYNER